MAASGNSITYTQSAGTVTVCTIGNASTTLASFDLGTSSSSVTNITGGTIIVQLANTSASGPRDYRNQSGAGTPNVTGGTLQLGNAASGAAKLFSIAGVIANLVIDNTSAGHSVQFLAPAVFNNITRNILINPGTTMNIGNNVFLMNGSTLTNNGTLTANGASSNFVWFLTTAPVVYTGTGVVTAPVTNFAMQADQGLTIDPASPNIVTTALRIFTGSITNANKITLGNGGATTGTLQIGNTTTPTNAGNLDVPLTFNLGTGGQTLSYLRTTASRSTGPEVNPTRIVTTLTRDDNDATHTLTIAGGDLTLSSTGTALTLTNGRIVTAANTLALSSGSATVTRTNGLVDGNLRKNYAAAVSKTFEVGTANGYSPVTVNITSATFPIDFTVKATQGPQPNLLSPQFALQRYWTLTGTGVTADLTFNYLDPTDIPGTAIENNFVIQKFDGSFSTPGGSVNTAANTATITGATGFSDWTLAQPNAPSALPARISGRITDNNGNALGGVTVHLSGSQSDRTITNANGNYQFDNLLTDRFYVVAPLLPNYTFNPSERTYALLGNRSDAMFTGIGGETITNPLTGGDFFVRQQYLDFLGREPDREGWLYWTAQIAVCGTNEACIKQRRIDVSAAFFDSEEFQRTGSFIYRLYKAGMGRRFTFTEFSTDQPHVLDGPDLENNRNAFTEQFVGRPEFMQKYENAISAEAYVDSLLTTVWQSSGVDLTANRNALLATYARGGSLNESRGLVLRQIVDSAELRQAEYNPGFVLMEYFGYLRRDPDQGGFDFWLDLLNNRQQGNYRGMVCAFITSAEYQRRFSSVVTAANSDCGQ